MLTDTPEWLGDFPANNFSSETLDALMAFGVSHRDIEDARALFATKWWDYRFAHPGHCFFLFAHHYSEVTTRYRSLFGIYPTANLSANHCPMFRDVKVGGKGNVSRTQKDLTPKAWRTAIWRGMCIADSHGVPYDRWISLAFEYAFNDKWEKMPHPSALYADRLATYVLEKWREEEVNIMRLPNDPRYLVKNYGGHPWQDAQEAWLLDLIGARPLPHIPLAQYLYREGRIREDVALRKLGMECVQRARAQIR